MFALLVSNHFGNHDFPLPEAQLSLQTISRLLTSFWKHVILKDKIHFLGLCLHCCCLTSSINYICLLPKAQLFLQTISRRSTSIWKHVILPLLCDSQAWASFFRVMFALLFIIPVQYTWVMEWNEGADLMFVVQFWYTLVWRKNLELGCSNK
jgi:hypothetical protein